MREREKKKRKEKGRRERRIRVEQTLPATTTTNRHLCTCNWHCLLSRPDAFRVAATTTAISHRPGILATRGNCRLAAAHGKKIRARERETAIKNFKKEKKRKTIKVNGEREVNSKKK